MPCLISAPASSLGAVQILVKSEKFNQLDGYVWQRLRDLRVERKGRNLKPGDLAKWPREYFWNLGLHRLRGTVQYPQRPFFLGTA